MYLYLPLHKIICCGYSFYLPQQVDTIQMSLWVLIWIVIQMGSHNICFYEDNQKQISREYCYDRALLPSIICLGRLRIASKYIFNIWPLHQGVDSLAQWLEHWIFNREDRVRIPRQVWKFFQLCFIPSLRLSCRKMGAHPGLDFICWKWLHVIINDDFLEEGECYDRALLPSIICLGRLRIASKYIFNIW